MCEFEFLVCLYKILQYTLFGYGAPAVCCAVAAGGWSSGFGNNAGNCWLSTDGDRLIWAFLAPMILVSDTSAPS